MARQTVVGFGGVSQGGKSTLCQRLSATLTDSVVIGMDQYYWDIDSSDHKRVDFVDREQFPDWDCFEAIDWDSLIADIKDYTEPGTERRQPVLIEGTMILNYRPLSEFLTHRYFLTLPYDEARQRRSKIAEDRFEPVRYFDDIVWPAYQRCFTEQHQHGSSVVFLDGTVPADENVNRILTDLTAFLC